jgi:RNA polymerase sigma-70 factor, ECF subfamily
MCASGSCASDVTSLLRDRRDQLERFATTFAADPHERDELVQLVMIRVWRGHEGFSGRSSMSTWLYQIVRNTAASQYQRRSARPIPLDPEVVPPVATPGPEDSVVDRDAIDRALHSVPVPFRDTVDLIDRWGCRPAEVATAAGISEATARTRLHRGRRALRNALTHS